jgi:hypothetical protein
MLEMFLLIQPVLVSLRSNVEKENDIYATRLCDVMASFNIDKNSANYHTNRRLLYLSEYRIHYLRLHSLALPEKYTLIWAMASFFLTRQTTG